MLKMIGLLGLTLSFGLMGVKKAGRLKERIQLLEDLQNLISALKSRMNYFRDPMILLLQNMEKTESFPLPGQVRRLMSEQGLDISDAWEYAVRMVYEKSALNQEDIKVLEYVGSYIGQSDFENQQMQFQLTQERIQMQLDDARKMFAQKGSMYRQVGFFAGALVSLVIL